MLEIDISGLGHDFDGRAVFRGLDFRCADASLAITGPNGSGKSTLVRIIAGLLTPSAGKVALRLEGGSVSGSSIRELVGVAAPDVRLYPELSARENLHFLTRARGIQDARRRVDEALGEVGLSDRADDPVCELSSGLRQRAALAAAVAHDPALLLLDEPFMNLDDAGAAMLRELIESQKRRGMLILATTSDNEAELCSTRLDLGAAR